MSLAILCLHELLRRELRDLAQARYLPRGWTREGSLKVDAKLSELGKYLTEALEGTPDRLLAYPRRTVLEPLLSQAAQERTLRAMVGKMVTLFSAIPETDQAAAYAMAELADQQAGFERLKSQAQTLHARIAEMKADALMLNIDLSELDEALHRVNEAVRSRARHNTEALQAHTLE